MPNTPELGQRSVIPKFTPIQHFIQFSNTHAVFVGRHLFGHNIHCYLCQIHIRTDACRRRDAGSGQHVTDHLHRQFVGSQLIGSQIGRHIHKHLVDAIDVYVFRSNVF